MRSVVDRSGYAAHTCIKKLYKANSMFNCFEQSSKYEVIIYLDRINRLVFVIKSVFCRAETEF